MALFTAATVTDFACSLLAAEGLEAEKARAVAEVLVEADLMGHTTHGLALLSAYLRELENGGMAKAGEPAVVADYPAAVTWDGLRLPGPWLVRQALNLATARARINGTCTVVIRRSHHIACLAAYLRPIAEQGMVAMVTCSDPALAMVAPHGGRRGVITPNPIAAAWPTAGDPVIFDVSMSIATHALTNRLRAAGDAFPGEWAIDGEGRPTRDPAAVVGNPPGALLPVGGVDHGHKGYALGLLVETLTGGLAGFGRADAPQGWHANVCVQVWAPALFGGEVELRRQTEHLAAACRTSPPRPGFSQVRLPGDAALRRRREQLVNGAELHHSILPALRPWAEKLAVAMPRANP